MSTPVVDHRAPAGTGAHAGAAPLAARVLRQAGYETGTALRNGEHVVATLEARGDRGGRERGADHGQGEHAGHGHVQARSARGVEQAGDVHAHEREQGQHGDTAVHRRCREQVG